MRSVLVLSISSFCLAVSVVGGLAAYTTTHLPDEALAGISVQAMSGRHAALVPERLHREPRNRRCATRPGSVGGAGRSPAFRTGGMRYGETWV